MYRANPPANSRLHNPHGPYPSLYAPSAVSPRFSLHLQSVSNPRAYFPALGACLDAPWSVLELPRIVAAHTALLLSPNSIIPPRYHCSLSPAPRYRPSATPRVIPAPVTTVTLPSDATANVPALFLDAAPMLMTCMTRSRLHGSVVVPVPRRAVGFLYV
jgi:hypothetical protein